MIGKGLDVTFLRALTAWILSYDHFALLPQHLCSECSERNETVECQENGKWLLQTAHAIVHSPPEKQGTQAEPPSFGWDRTQNKGGSYS